MLIKTENKYVITENAFYLTETMAEKFVYNDKERKNLWLLRMHSTLQKPWLKSLFIKTKNEKKKTKKKKHTTATTQKFS